MDSAQLRTHDFQRILLLKLSALGDVAHTFPVLQKLRARYPHARIDWLVKPAFAELVGNHPAVSNVIVFPDADLRAPWRAPGQAVQCLTRLVAALRSAKYDLVIDLHGQFRTASLALVTGSPVRIGFDRPRRAVRENSARDLPAHVYKHAWVGAREGSWLAYTHRMTLDTLDRHAVDRYLRLGLVLGFDPAGPDFSFPIAETAAQRADALLAAHGIATGSAGFVLLAPGTVWETKQWRAAGFGEVARHLRAKGWPVVLIGSGKDAAACGAVAAAAEGVVNLCGQTSLSELAAVMRRAAVAVTNDSGPMHLAVALGRPTVSIFGPTDAVWIGPYGQPRGVLAADLPCAPCYLRRLRDCPNGHACMAAIPASAVIARVEELLGPRPSAGAEPAPSTREAFPRPGHPRPQLQAI